MLNKLKWLLPMAAAVALLVGVSALQSRAADEKKEGPKGSITGTVVDKDGKALAEGIKVNLMKPFQRRGGGGGGGGGPAGGGAGGAGGGAAEKSAANPDAIGLQQQQRPGRPEPLQTVKTDKEGKFTMKDVPVGDYTVGVRDDEKKIYGRKDVKVEDGKTAEVKIKTSDTPPQRGRRGGAGGGGAGGAEGGAGGGAKQ
jgi:hypothetical protein